MIVVVDYFTKWVEVEPMTTINSIIAINFMVKKLFVGMVSTTKSSLITGRGLGALTSKIFCPLQDHKEFFSYST